MTVASRSGIIMLGVTFGRNHHVWIRIENSIVEEDFSLRSSGIDPVYATGSCQLIDPLAISVITVVTGELITQYKPQSVKLSSMFALANSRAAFTPRRVHRTFLGAAVSLHIPLVQPPGVLITIYHLRKVAIGIPKER